MRSFKLLPLLLGLAASAMLAQVRLPAVAPVPPDPYEIVSGPAQVLATSENRADVLASLERARQNAFLHAPDSAPYRLNVSIEANGYGSGRMEEVWMSGMKWRWSASLGSYSELRIGRNQVVYASGAGLPLRLQTLRNAIFWPVTSGPGGSLRIASGRFQGMQLLCVLQSRGGFREQAPAPRRWEETEYCVDPQSGLLHVYSQAPGMYVVFDYQQALKFHGRTLPRQITVYEAGAKVVEARLDSIEDETSGADELFTPTAQMVAQGPAATTTGPVRFPQPAPLPGFGGTIYPVIVHASIGPDGRVLEAEALQKTSAELSAAAVDLVKRSTYPSPNRGTRPHQQEAFINVRFGVAVAQAPAKSGGQ